MIKTTHFSIQCPQCGAVDFQQPDDVQDDDLVTCDFCGLQIKLSELKEVGLEQAKKIAIPEAKKVIEDMLKKVFKGRLK